MTTHDHTAEDHITRGDARYDSVTDGGVYCGACDGGPGEHRPHCRVACGCYDCRKALGRDPEFDDPYDEDAQDALAERIAGPRPIIESPVVKRAREGNLPAKDLTEF